MSLPSPPPPKNKKTALLIAAALMLAHLTLAAVLLIPGIQYGVLEMQIGSGIILGIALASGVGAVLIQKNRLAQGGWLMIGAVVILTPPLSLFSSGLGWISLIAIPLVVAWVARAMLPSQHFPKAVALGIISGVGALIIDTYGPADRAAMPQSQFIIPAIAVLLGIVAIATIAHNFRHYRLQTKLLIMFLLVSLVPMGLLVFFNNRETRESLIESANQSLLSAGTQTRNRVDAFFQDTETALQSEARLSLIRTYLTSVTEGQPVQPGNVSVALATLHEKDPTHIRTYAILDRSGKVLLSYPRQFYLPYMGVNQEYKNYMQNSMLAGLPYYTPVLFDENDRPVIFFVAPIYHISQANTPVGLLLVQYDGSILQDLVVGQNGLAGPESFGILVDEDQIYLANGQHPELLYKTVAPLPPERFEHLVSVGRLPSQPQEKLTANQEELSEVLSLATPAEPFFTFGDQPAQQAAVTWLDSQVGWQVGFQQPQEVFLTVVREQTRNTIPLILFSAVIVAAASLGAARVIGAPISNLTELVERISAGDLSIQVPVTTKDEIGRLAAAFNAMTAQLRGLLGGLEDQIAARTRELERQAVQLQTAAQVARDVSTLQDLNALLDRVVNLIHDRFGFYHAGVFLLDERQEYAILQAANSEGGKEMLRRGHQLKVGETGIVGYVTSRGEPRIALDVDADTTHFAHPLLPETRSEMALPLIAGGKIIGALDVQSKEANAFDESDIAVLQVLADQLAIAIENSRLLTEVRQTVDELQAAYGATTREAWLKWTRRANKPIGYRYRGLDVEPAPEKPPEAILAIRQGQVITKVAADPAKTGSTLAIPIQLRGQTFGAIQLRIEGDEIPPDLIRLASVIADRLATALESARLYEEVQRRAAQEKISSEIAARIRETLDINTIMKTAVQEIGQKLELHDIAIQIELNEDAAGDKD